MIKHVIWDFDGTLFDSYPFLVAAFSDALVNNGFSESADAIAAQFMNSESAAIDYFADKYGLGDELGRNYFYHKSVGDLGLIKPFSGAEEICRAIKRSGRANYILTHRDDTAKQIVELNGMSEYFTEIVTSENGFKRKPDPQGIFYLMDKYDMNPEETMIVGDRELEIKLGENAGIISCFFANGTSHTSIEPDYTVCDLLRIVDFI